MHVGGARRPFPGIRAEPGPAKQHDRVPGLISQASRNTVMENPAMRPTGGQVSSGKVRGATGRARRHLRPAPVVLRGGAPQVVSLDVLPAQVGRAPTWIGGCGSAHPPRTPGPRSRRSRLPGRLPHGPSAPRSGPRRVRIVVECMRLESARRETVRGFESHTLRRPGVVDARNHAAQPRSGAPAVR